MPEIFIAETETANEKELRRLAAAVEDLEQIAAFAEWFEGQGDTVKELGRELLAIQEARGMNPRFQLDTEERYGKPLYVAHCANGRHESRQSLEHALFLMVDSFRTRAEDRPETHARLMEVHGCDVKAARKLAAEMAENTRARFPAVSGEMRDAFLADELGKVERDVAARKAEQPKERKDPPSVKK